MTEPDWSFAILLDDLWEGDMVGVRVAGVDVLLVHLAGDEIRAYDDRCPHQGTRLSEGHLHATTLRCGTHLWEFDVRSGDGINPRSCRLRSYPVRIVDGAVQVLIERSAA